jgi:hypothetical protein
MADTLLNILQESYDIEDGVFEDLGLRPYVMYLVTIASSGGDADLGVKGTETKTKKKITPNPRVRNVSLAKVAQSGGYLKMGDIEAYVSAKNYTKVVLEAANFLEYQDNLYKIIRIDAVEDISMPLQWKLLLRRHNEA